MSLSIQYVKLNKKFEEEEDEFKQVTGEEKYVLNIDFCMFYEL
jgi:hypothetical protein